MAEEEKPRTSRFKIDSPSSRVKVEDDEDKNKKGTSMRKSWSTDSLGLLNNSKWLGKTCVCAPTKHEGSFRCRLHRSSTTSHGAAATTQLHLPKPSLFSPSR
ncbi:unnamed protein product [Arabis nemorensis]|uniref:Uncharacterized protein n=1 Tax=Arabis nemorensis TaxID=586526 RepID=A0A565BX24_9BRAS|nr:unnamed protein product [Arabis nemorensis]